jgi:integration host factor subunit alpha
MSENTLTRADLTEAVYKELGLSRQDSADLVTSVFELMSKELEKGVNVKLSSFGGFEVRDKGSRIGRNPKTRQDVVIEPRRVVVFKPSQVLKERVDAAQSK